MNCYRGVGGVGRRKNSSFYQWNSSKTRLTSSSFIRRKAAVKVVAASSPQPAAGRRRGVLFRTLSLNFGLHGGEGGLSNSPKLLRPSSSGKRRNYYPAANSTMAAASSLPESSPVFTSSHNQASNTIRLSRRTVIPSISKERKRRLAMAFSEEDNPPTLTTLPTSSLLDVSLSASSMAVASEASRRLIRYLEHEKLFRQLEASTALLAQQDETYLFPLASSYSPAGKDNMSFLSLDTNIDTKISKIELQKIIPTPPIAEKIIIDNSRHVESLIEAEARISIPPIIIESNITENNFIENNIIEKVGNAELFPTATLSNMEKELDVDREEIALKENMDLIVSNLQMVSFNETSLPVKDMLPTIPVTVSTPLEAGDLDRLQMLLTSSSTIPPTNCTPSDPIADNIPNLDHTEAPNQATLKLIPKKKKMSPGMRRREEEAAATAARFQAEGEKEEVAKKKLSLSMQGFFNNEGRKIQSRTIPTNTPRRSLPLISIPSVFPDLTVKPPTCCATCSSKLYLPSELSGSQGSHFPIIEDTIGSPDYFHHHHRHHHSESHILVGHSSSDPPLPQKSLQILPDYSVPFVKRNKVLCSGCKERVGLEWNGKFIWDFNKLI